MVMEAVLWDGDGGKAMNQTQLQALATYRTHKYCRCPECEMARAILRDMDGEKATPQDPRDGASPPLLQLWAELS